MIKWMKSIAEKSSTKKFFHWSTLYSIGASPILSIAIYGAILVPFLSAEIKVLQELKLLGKTSFNGLSLPITMLCSYLFSLIFASTSIIASLLCPATIKLHGNIVAFLSDISNVSRQIKPSITLKSSQADLERFKKDDLTDKDIAAVIQMIVEQRGQKDFDKTVADVTNQAVEDWTKMENEATLLRFSLGVAYLISFALAVFTFFVLMPISIIF